jgi:RNA-directed DNA polymerase
LLSHRRPLRSRQGGYVSANIHLVAPLEAFAPASAPTDMRSSDTQLELFGPGSGAAGRLIDRPYADLRPAGVYVAIDRRTPPTATTPGSSRSATATRTTITRTTGIWRARSAEESGAGLSYSSLLRAWLLARRGKRSTQSALAFEAGLEDEFATIHDQVNAGEWTPGRSICFPIIWPKLREVWAAPFPDRVVHHAWYAEIGPRFERAFIADSCACIVGRGTHYAVRRLEAKVRAITRNWTRPAYYLKCDVANFFPSISKSRLQALLERRIPEPFWRDLTARIILNDPRPDVDLRGDRHRLERISPGKSLFHCDADHGLPIGNLPSQFGANVYLDVLDQHVKHVLKVRHYVRYVDDFVLLSESPAELTAWHDAIEAFLPKRLGLELNPRKTIRQPVARGIDFVGHLIKPHRTVLRRRTFHAAMARLAAMPAEDLAESATSYLGLCRQASHSHHDRARIANLARRRGFSVDHQLTKVLH